MEREVQNHKGGFLLLFLLDEFSHGVRVKALLQKKK